MSLQLERRLLYPILEEAIAGIQPLVDKKGIHIELNCEETLTALVDADKIRQIMTDLLDNALKYTETGGYVGVVVTAVSNRDVQICVEDTGIGIAETDLDLIFDRFHRVTGPRSSSIGGIGLGLPIVKNLVELHGGEVKVESEIGEGSRFYITLKLGS
jgi:signal transduction histidine kinase